MADTPRIERLDALESLITDFNAHTVLLLQGKRAFVPGWNKRGATIQEIEEHLATDPLSNVGIIPYSVNTHVLDVDRGDPKDWYSFREKIDPLCVFDSRRKLEGDSDLGCHVYLTETENHQRKINLAVASLIFDSICGTGYVALWDQEAIGLLYALRERESGVLSDLSIFGEIETLLTGRAEVERSPSPKIETASFRDLRDLRDGDGRNDALFRLLAGSGRQGIAWHMVKRFQSKAVFMGELKTAAFGINAIFAEKQHPDRVLWTVGNIGDYVWKRRNAHMFGTSDSTVQQARGKRRGESISKERERFDQKVEMYLAQGLDVNTIASIENRHKSTIYRAKKRIESGFPGDGRFAPAKESHSHQPKNRDEFRHSQTGLDSHQPITRKTRASARRGFQRDSSESSDARSFGEGVDYVIHDPEAMRRHRTRFDCDDATCGKDACNVCYARNYKKFVAEERAKLHRREFEKEEAKRKELERQTRQRQAALDFFASKIAENH